MEKNIDELKFLIDFFNTLNDLEKNFPNNYEFGEKIRNLILESKDKLNK